MCMANHLPVLTVSFIFLKGTNHLIKSHSKQDFGSIFCIILNVETNAFLKRYSINISLYLWSCFKAVLSAGPAHRITMQFVFSSFHSLHVRCNDMVYGYECVRIMMRVLLPQGAERSAFCCENERANVFTTTDCKKIMYRWLN